MLKTTNSPSKVAEIITQRFIDEIKTTGFLPWQKPWFSIHAQNIVSKKAYRGINVLMLALFGENGTDFLTFNQAKAADGFIGSKGKGKGIPIVFYTKLPPKEQFGKDGKPNKGIFLMRYYTVFNFKYAEGTKGLVPQSAKLNKVSPIIEAERLLERVTCPIVTGGNSACYYPGMHKIGMPLPGQFKSPEHYYCALFHEVGHSLSKDRGIELEAGFGSEQYSKEELVAELFANFCLSHVGIDSANLFDNSKAYLGNWLSKFAGDSKLLIQASSEAQKRFDILLGITYGAKPEDVQAEPDTTAAVEAEAVPA
jgi:antirestriction protein ArdC